MIKSPNRENTPHPQHLLIFQTLNTLNIKHQKTIKELQRESEWGIPERGRETERKDWSESKYQREGTREGGGKREMQR